MLVQMSVVCLCPFLREKLYEVGLLVGSQHEIHPVDGTNALGLKLGIATGDYDKGSLVGPHHAIDSLTALAVGNIRHRTGVY